MNITTYAQYMSSMKVMKNDDILVSMEQGKLHSITTYIQIDFTTTIRKHFHTKNGKLPALSTLFEWAEDWISKVLLKILLDFKALQHLRRRF